MVINRLHFAGVLLAAMPLLAGAGNRTQSSDTHARDEAQADLLQAERDRHERLTVPVTIDGNGPYRFLIDTGAQATVVTHELVDALALRHSRKVTVVAMGGSSEVDAVELDNLEFANRSISGLISPTLHSSNIGADGILGLDSLQQTRVLIDFRSGRMKIADSPGEANNSGYEIIVRARRKLGQMIITDARVDGVRTAVIVDTGAQTTIANSTLVRKMRARELSAVRSIDVIGTLMTHGGARIRTMTIGGAELSNLPIAVADSPIFTALGLADKPALVLGIANLRAFDRVAIDFATQRILFDVPARNINYASTHDPRPLPF